MCNCVVRNTTYVRNKLGETTFIMLYYMFIVLNIKSKACHSAKSLFMLMNIIAWGPQVNDHPFTPSYIFIAHYTLNKIAFVHCINF